MYPKRKSWHVFIASSFASLLHLLASWFLGTHWPVDNTPKRIYMIDDQDLGFFANFLGIFIFVLVVAYHYVMADPKYEGN